MLTRKKKVKIAKNLAYVIVALERTEMHPKLFCECQDKLMDIAEMFDNKTLNITYWFIQMLRNELKQRSDT